MSLKYLDGYLTLIQKNQKIPLLKLAQQIKKPFYLYDLNGLVQRYQFFKKNLDSLEIYFSVKSNNCFSLVQKLIENGSGLDIVSQGEFEFGKSVGCSPQKMVFSGVGKTKEELEKALSSDLFQINVESLQELDRIGQICSSLKLKARVAYRINPNISLQTHKYIQTGTSEHKFGMEEKFIPKFNEIVKKYSPYIQFQGLAMHIGSQGLSIDPILTACEVVRNVYERLNKEGYHLTTLDIGGGIGIDYQSEDGDEERIEEYGAGLKRIFKNFEGRILCEPGRILVGRYGWLIGEVQYIKQTSRVSFAILNTGIHHLIRPALYQAYHRVLNLKQNQKEKKVYTLAGPVCETSDVLARDRLLEELESGDCVAFCDVGAYGSVMQMKYNMFESPQEISYFDGKPV